MPTISNPVGPPPLSPGDGPISRSPFTLQGMLTSTLSPIAVAVLPLPGPAAALLSSPWTVAVLLSPPGPRGFSKGSGLPAKALLLSPLTVVVLLSPDAASAAAVAGDGGGVVVTAGDGPGRAAVARDGGGVVVIAEGASAGAWRTLPSPVTLAMLLSPLPA